jgi:16S rRNA (cytidine1402-2'-O)-methyltransferase
MAEKNKVLGGCLYLVGTPIGNMQDLSERAKKVLSEVNFIAAEDTRNSYKLLSLIGVSTELVSYHEHNKKASGKFPACLFLYNKLAEENSSTSL